MLKEIKEYLNNWNNTYVHGLKNNIFKIVITPNWLTVSVQSLSKFQLTIFVRYWQVNYKIQMEIWGIQNA